MKTEQLQSYLDQFWDNEITPTLTEYIKIPNKSPAFDPDWEKNGHTEKALKLAVGWADNHRPKESLLHVKRLDGRTPIIMVEIPGEREGNILMYGHLDKQPEMEGWNEGFGPWEPVMKDGKLYGRGGADDGYALFASLGVIKALIDQGLALPRIVILIEFCEESGSPDLPYYINEYVDIIGKVDLVICLDSGAGNYEQFWTTVSLRGMVACELRVDVLTEGVHSGSASGLVPSSFRILRQLLSRVEDEVSGEIKVEELHTNIPNHRIDEVKKMVSALGGKTEAFPWHNNMSPSTDDPVEGTLKRTWTPTLSYVGMDGVPAVKDGGNVLRPYTTLKLSFRLPPDVDCHTAMAGIEKVLNNNPPSNATVRLKWEEPANGWNAPKLSLWLDQAIQEASDAFYGKPALAMGEGGTIPFMAMLGEKFPDAQFVITGVLGPESNAHGPNEFLHIPFAKKLSACIGYILNQYPR
ncbi:MAG: M20/M25/M40 family metallo-hydrolase [Candidatus Marinimicrobia bacterium]|nr:M20/M25/M40 family metallo-hydrolase [Candidatus Neomarinimicrobiota bacterium]MBL7031219.1 M20/M25/M40 family metallo-hydrolase [Candidatus Neomarinimicrobiota bacterium]